MTALAPAAAADRSPDVETVPLWTDAGTLELLTLPRDPILTGVGMPPERLTLIGRAIRFPDRHAWYEQMHRRLTRLAAASIRHWRPRFVTTGLAPGWETALAEAAEGLRVPYRVVLPYRGLSAGWPLHQRQRFGRLLARADATSTVYSGPGERWMTIRAAERRLAAADLVLTLWDGPDAADPRLLRAARDGGAEVRNLWRAWQRHGGLLETGTPSAERPVVG